MTTKEMKQAFEIWLGIRPYHVEEDKTADTVRVVITKGDDVFQIIGNAKTSSIGLITNGEEICTYDFDKDGMFRILKEIALKDTVIR